MMELEMPRVFFDFDGGDRHYEDTEGTELVDLTMVRSEATRFLATAFKDTPADTGNRVFAVRVRDTQDRVIYTITLTLRENWIETAGMEAIGAPQSVGFVVEDDWLARAHARS
jgi:hypothetical protein